MKAKRLKQCAREGCSARFVATGAGHRKYCDEHFVGSDPKQLLRRRRKVGATKPARCRIAAGHEVDLDEASTWGELWRRHGRADLVDVALEDDPYAQAFLRDKRGPVTLDELGEFFGLGRERMRQIITAALERLERRSKLNPALVDLLQAMRERDLRTAWDHVEDGP
jgi:hypothetical protein